MSSKQYVVELPFRHPNWFGSILSLTSSINHVTTKSSRTFDRHQVNEIGLKSPSAVGDCIFGMGIILDSFKITGTIPDREWVSRSNAPTARLPTLARLAETLTRDWLNTNEPREMVMPTITLLYIINWQTTTLTGTLLSALLTYSTNYFQRLTLESWYTKPEQTPLNRCQQLPALYKRLMQEGLKPTNDWWQTLDDSFSQYHHG